jgi:hypothetical protein
MMKTSKIISLRNFLINNIIYVIKTYFVIINLTPIDHESIAKWLIILKIPQGSDLITNVNGPFNIKSKFFG